MRESVTYQEILQEGRQEGRQEGMKNALTIIILKQLTRKFGTLPPKLHSRIIRSHVPRLENLAEAVLDFEGLADLEAWLNKK